MVSTVDTAKDVKVYNVSNGVELFPGQEMRTFNFPFGFVSSCCFGGVKYDDLYVTSGSWPGANKVLSGPSAGSVFKISGLGVKGLPAAVYEG